MASVKEESERLRRERQQRIDEQRAAGAKSPARARERSDEEKAKLREGTMGMREEWVAKNEKKMNSKQILDDVVTAASK